MIEDVIRTFVLPDKEIQRVQIVSLDSWNDLNFFIPEYEDECFQRLCSLYENYIVKKYAMIFGRIIMFHVPDDYRLPSSFDNKDIFDRTVLVSDNFRKNIRYRKGRMIFLDKDTEKVYRELVYHKQLKVIEGKRKYLYFMPVGNKMGFLSKSRMDSSFKVNSSFFVFDCLDVRSSYDQVGSSIGLCLKDGEIINPPAFDREVFTVDKHGHAAIENISLKDIDIQIDDQIFTDGMNASIYARPLYRKTPAGGYDVIIVSDRIVAVNEGGRTAVPTGGFVLKLNRKIDIKDHKVRYHGLEKYTFAIQVGNSVIRDGKKTESFISDFYDFRQFWKASYPPSMYPLSFDRDRAPRIVLGADENARPHILWFEGAGKFGHVKGQDSAGVSLKEEAEICEMIGLHDAINLDGGGSAQILLNNKKALKISDRDPLDDTEIERAVGMSLFA